MSFMSMISEALEDTAKSYLMLDKKYPQSYQKDGFELVKIKDGKYPAIVCIDGFMSEDDIKISDIWLKNLSKHYGENMVYYVKWEAKNIVKLIEDNWDKSNFSDNLLKGLFHSVKSVVTDISDYWDEVNKKAQSGGIALAKEMIKTDKKYILIGHSLGAKIIFTCMEKLSEANRKDAIESVHFLGGAIDKRENWQKVSKVVNDKIYNYFNEDDFVLKYLYKAGELGRYELLHEPIGISKICETEKIKNINISNIVSNHNDYKQNLKKILNKSIKTNQSCVTCKYDT